jgi:hypothetical protein
VTGVSPVAGATNIPITARPSATFSEPVDRATVNASTVALRDPANQVVRAALGYDPTAKIVEIVPRSPLANSTTYTATITGGAAGVKDLAGNPLAADKVWSFTTEPTTSLFRGVTPGAPPVGGVNALELGVKFRADVSGYVRGIRFFRIGGNTETYACSLWTSTGTRLATTTFDSGSLIGDWQQVLFAQPVAVTAGTLYVASYHINTSNYAAENNYFANQSADYGPLHAPRDSDVGGNGVYLYSATSAFPTNSYKSTNYWVDVVYSTSP